jgi:hypothetical protein
MLIDQEKLKLALGLITRAAARVATITKERHRHADCA